jgi:two-component system phosphate regulon response regulator PhoB
MSNSSSEAPSEGDAFLSKLTATERRLLVVLQSQPGRTFTRAELVALVMPDVIVLHRTVDVHVKALRKKMGSRSTAIQTIRRVGYRWLPPT